MDAIEAMVLL